MPIELSPRECEFLLEKLDRLESLEQLIAYYKAEKRRLLAITDPKLYETDPDRYEVQE